jgi:hypothetical protein
LNYLKGKEVVQEAQKDVVTDLLLYRLLDWLAQFSMETSMFQTTRLPT